MADCERETERSDYLPKAVQGAVLQFGDQEAAGKIADVSEGGFGVIVEGEFVAREGDVIRLKTVAGWSDAKVVNFTEVPEGFRYGLQRQLPSENNLWNPKGGGQASPTIAVCQIRDKLKSAEEPAASDSRSESRGISVLAFAGLVTVVTIGLLPIVHSTLSRWRSGPKSDYSAGDVQVALGQSRAEPELLKANPDSLTSSVSAGQTGAKGDPPAVSAIPAGQDSTFPSTQMASSDSAGFETPRASPEQRRASDAEPKPGGGTGEASGREQEDIPLRLLLGAPVESEGAAVIPSWVSDLSAGAIESEPERIPIVVDWLAKPAAVKPDRGEWRRASERGFAAYWKGDRAGARAGFEAAMKEHEEATVAYFLAMSCYQQGDDETAGRWLARAVELERNDAASRPARLLARVQGPHRRWIEEARSKARRLAERPGV